MIPLGTGIYCLLLVALRKNNLKNAGKSINIEQYQGKNNKALTIIGIICFILLMLIAMLGGIIGIIICIIFALPSIANNILTRSYKKISGIYENDIITKKYIPWIEIFSWE